MITIAVNKNNFFFINFSIYDNYKNFILEKMYDCDTALSIHNLKIFKLKCLFLDTPRFTIRSQTWQQPQSLGTTKSSTYVQSTS